MRIWPAILGAALLLGCGANDAPKPVARGAIAFPDVPLSSVDDAPARISNVRNGAPTLVALWATWCEACLAEQPSLVRLARAAAPRGGRVIAVAVGEEPSIVRAYLERRPVPLPQLVDPEFQLAEALGVKSLPAVLVVAADGRIVHQGQALDHDALEAFRRELFTRE